MALRRQEARFLRFLLCFMRLTETKSIRTRYTRRERSGVGGCLGLELKFNPIQPTWELKF